jgi:hypothetical protein
MNQLKMRPAGYYPYPPPSCQPLGAKGTDTPDQQYYFWIAKSFLAEKSFRRFSLQQRINPEPSCHEEI